MSIKDLEKMCRFHYTSKSSTWNEDNELNSYGFRGRTLANLSCLCQVKIRSRQRDELRSLKTTYSLSSLTSPITSCTGPAGTKVTVKGFISQYSDEITNLKSNKDLESEIEKLVNMFSIIHHKVSFKVYDSKNSNKVIIRSNSVLEAFRRVFPNARELKVITYHFESDEYSGYFVLSHPNTTNQDSTIFTAINGRYFECDKLNEIITSCYTEVQQNSHPICILFLRHKMPINEITRDFSPPDPILEEIKTFLSENLVADGWTENPQISFDGFAVRQGAPQFDIPLEDVQRLLIPTKMAHAEPYIPRPTIPGPIVRRIAVRPGAMAAQPSPIQVRHVGALINPGTVPVPVQVQVPMQMQVPVPVPMPVQVGNAPNVRPNVVQLRQPPPPPPPPRQPLTVSPPHVNFAVEPAVLAGTRVPPPPQVQVSIPGQGQVQVPRVVQRTVIAPPPPPAAVSQVQPPHAVVVKTIPKKPVVKRIVANPIQPK